MGTVTGLRLQARGKRVSVYLDGSLAFALARTLAAGLRKGQVLSQADQDRLAAENEVELGLERCLGLLARRPRSRTELEAYLRRRGLEPEIRTRVLERLSERGLVDDEVFAQSWVENRLAFRPRSRRALQAELRRKGIAEATAAQALADVDEGAAAREAARGRASRLAGSGRAEFRRKLLGYLERRGFSYEIAAPIVHELWHELHSPAGISSEG